MTFSQATGEILDWYGEMVGEPREDLDDFTYRKLIKCAFEARRSDGSRDALIRMWVAATADSFVQCTLLPPNGLMLVAYRSEYMPAGYAERVSQLVRRATPFMALDLVECMGPPLGVERDLAPLELHSYFGVGIPARVH